MSHIIDILGHNYDVILLFESRYNSRWFQEMIRERENKAFQLIIVLITAIIRGVSAIPSPAAMIHFSVLAFLGAKNILKYHIYQLCTLPNLSESAIL